jgi:DNA-binding CsgD family transcriptional regulator/PAS domain-containing protein
MSNSNNRGTVDIAEFSELVGAIYDCVLDPDRWGDVMRRIGEATQCRSSSLTVTDLDPPRTMIFKFNGVEPQWRALYKPEYSFDAVNFFRLALAQPAFNPDVPLVATHIMPPEMHETMPVFRDWAIPQGFHDVMSTVPLATPERLVTLDMIRHSKDGPIAARDIEVLALLAPHVRRAMTISNLFDLRAIEIGSFKAAIEALSVGIVLVDVQSKVIEANQSAAQILLRSGLVTDEQGRLISTDDVVNADLQDAIKRAFQSDTSLGTRGLGIRLTAPRAEAILAHVLPLTTGALRSRLTPLPTAAIFLTSAENTPRSGMDALAVTYDLTGAEARIFAEVARGHDAAAAAEACGITEGTARTHLKRIYAKLGVSRQAELVNLVNRLLPPMQPMPSASLEAISVTAK